MTRKTKMTAMREKPRFETLKYERLIFLGGFAVLAILLLALTPCQTTRGLGEDIEALGGEVRETAAETTYY